MTIDFPIIADPTREIATLYGMLDPNLEDKSGLPLTCRAVGSGSRAEGLLRGACGCGPA